MGRRGETGDEKGKGLGSGEKGWKIRGEGEGNRIQREGEMSPYLCCFGSSRRRLEAVALVSLLLPRGGVEGRGEMGRGGGGGREKRMGRERGRERSVMEKRDYRRMKKGKLNK